MFYFTYPWSRNHVTALASASMAGLCGSPNSRTAFVASKNMNFFAICTPAKGDERLSPRQREIASLM